MKRKSLIALLLTALILFTGCTNSASRPKSRYANIRDFLAFYADETFATSAEFGGGFVRDLAGLVMKADDVNEFADWVVSAQTEAGVIVYTKSVKVFGYDAELTVGFEKKQKKVGAISLILQSGDPAVDFKIFSWFYKGLLETTAKPNQTFVDNEEKSSKEAEDLIAAYDHTHSIQGTWPKSSVKWQCTIQYGLSEDGRSFVGVYAK